MLNFKKRKKYVWLALISTLLLVLTGCDTNQQEIFNAALKMQNVNSMQSQTSMTFQLKGTGFDTAQQQQIDNASTFLNNAKLNFNMELSTNPQKTLNKAQMDFNLTSPSMNVDVPVWVNSDLTGLAPKATEIIKVPQIAASSLPAKLAGKEYMVIDPYNMGMAGTSPVDATSLLQFSKNFQEAEIAFLTAYAQQYNPNIDLVDNGVQYVQTPDGQEAARMYELKLNDAQFKDFISYTVNNFVNDPDAMNFVKNEMDSVLQISQVPNQAATLSEFDQTFNSFVANKQTFLTQFNNVMNQLKNVTILGDKGIDIQYAVSNGYIIQESGYFNFKLDLAQLNQLANNLDGQPNTPVEAKGVVDMTINFNSVISGINAPTNITLPAVDSSNSFNYTDLLSLANTATLNRAIFR